MKKYYNAETRQLIIVAQDTAISVYLQSDETPAQKAEEVIIAFTNNPKNVSICREVKPVTLGEPLPKEDGPEETKEQDATETTDGDDKKE